MNVSGQSIRKPRLGGWYVEIGMVGVALLIALLPSFLYFRTRSKTQASTVQLAQSDPSARIVDLRVGTPNQVSLPASPQWIVFSLELDGETGRGTYRAAITRSGGKLVWQASALSSQSTGKLTFVLSSDQIAPGNYTISVEPSATGTHLAASSFTFRASN